MYLYPRIIKRLSLLFLHLQSESRLSKLGNIKHLFMRYLRQTFLFLLLGTLLAACHHHTCERLLFIEELMKQKPDSALSLLHQIQKPEKLLGSNRALYALLMTQAMNHSSEDEYYSYSDSLISIAIDYYKTTPDSIHAALAYYNAGLIAMEDNNSEASLHNFLKTIDWLGNSDNDELQFMVRYKMSRLFKLRLIPDEELRLGKAALPYAERIGNPLYICALLPYITHGFMQTNQLDSAYKYSVQAIELAEKENLVRALSHIYSQHAHICMAMKDYKQALLYRDKDLAVLFKLFGKENEYVYDHYINKANTLTELHQYDSAFYYIHKVIEDTTDIQYTTRKFLAKAEIYAAVGRTDSAYYYMNRYVALQDKIMEQKDKEGLLVLHKNYHNDALKKANTLLWQQAIERKLQLYVVTIICCLAILLGVCVYFLLYKRKQQEVLRQKGQIAHQQELLKFREIEKLQAEKDLSEAKEREAEIREKEALLKVEFFKRLNETCIPVIENPRAQQNIMLKDEDWKIIFKNANTIFLNFTERLKSQYPALNEEDLRYCCMVKMQFTQTDIAKIMHLEKDSVKKRLKRIRIEKMGIAQETTLESVLRYF